MRRGVAVIVIVVAIVGAAVPMAGGSAAGVAPSRALPFEVPLEHLIITPSQQVPGSYEVLDVFRLRRAASGGAAGPEAAFSVPLPAGREAVRVVAGFREGTARVLPETVEGLVAWTEAEGSATVAVAYRVPASALPHPWPLVRPFAVGALLVLVHPDLEAAVAGAGQAGPVEVEGTTYVGFVRENLPAGEPVLLVAQSRPGAGGGGGLLPSRGAWAAVALAAAAAAAGAGAAVAWRRRGAAGLRRRRLVDAVLTLDAEFAAGYLEPERYRDLRRRLMERLAREMAAEGAGASSAVKQPAAGGGGSP